jgi:Ca2+-binding RTX toxin-like protein
MADFTGGPDDDFFFGDDTDETISGEGGNDFLFGQGGNDTISGGDGDDSLGGGSGNDQISGGAGDDFVGGDEGNDTLTGGLGSDLLSGGEGDDDLDGGDGDDTLRGGSGLDRLTGGAGSDNFIWSVAAGQFGLESTFAIQHLVVDFTGAGAAGGDTLTLATPPGNRPFVWNGQLAVMPALGGVLAGANNGATDVFYAFQGGNTFLIADSDDDGVLDADDFTVRFTGVKNFTTADFEDTTFATLGTAGADSITGTAGNDLILGLGGNDNLTGGDGDDTIDGGAGNDNISGGNGNDTLNGGDGNDTISGGAGSDRINGGEGSDTISGGDGTEAPNQTDDIINGGGGTDTINAGAGNDRADGGDGNDTINGGSGIDRLTGGAGADIIDGGAGRDTVLAGGDGNDIVRGGDGTDTLDGDDGNDQLFGGNDNDVLFGGDGSDIMNGDAGNDELFGGDGVDTINGGAGNDEIEGEERADTLTGGAGIDQFNFNAGSFQPDSTLVEQDLVTDFTGAGAVGGDVIRLSGDSFAFVGRLNIDPKKNAVLPGAFDGVTQLGYAIKNNVTYLIADNNDDGILNDSDTVVRFSGTHNFTQDDFDNTDFVIAGTNGDDTITGTEGDDRIFAAGGNDTVFALGGNDEVHGGTGDDFLDSGSGDFDFDQLFGEEGNDTLTLAGSGFGGTASGGDGNDVLFGSETAGGFSNSLQGDAGNDVLHAGTAGSFMSGGDGADQLVSNVGDDQIAAGRDPNTFELDDDQDLFVYSGTGRWSEEGSFFGDTVEEFRDGQDKFDLRGSGLQFSDLIIDNDGGFGPTITTTDGRGQITIFERFGEEVFVDETDFIFDAPLAAVLGAGGAAAAAVAPNPDMLSI